VFDNGTLIQAFACNVLIEIGDFLKAP
jgi:hypothetical protein